jgi:hypothetical protein
VESLTALAEDEQGNWEILDYQSFMQERVLQQAKSLTLTNQS